MKVLIIVLAAGAILLSGCGDSPTGISQTPNQLNPLAGGGRLRGDDPFGRSRYTDSVANFPGPEPWSGPIPDSGGEQWYTVFVSSFDCANDPGEVVIDNAADWEAWWRAANDCVWIQDSTMSFGNHHHADTFPHEPPDTTHPGHPGDEGEPPYIDFSQYWIAAIRIAFEEGPICMRGLYVQTIEREGTETVVYYEVFRVEGDCCDMIMAPLMLWAGSPVVAVAFERPESGPVRFVRSDTKVECRMPDPSMPITLHYTDTPCDLGPGEQLISDRETWDHWYRAAISCDSARWSYGFSGRPDWPDTVPRDSVPPGTGNWWWGTPDVDFNHYAIIILRASEQFRWGGGIWLTEIRPSNGGTTIEYCVMEPGAECPLIDVQPGRLEPTVAVRIPKPEGQVFWQRSVEVIDCNWGVDSTVVVPF